MSNHLRHCPKHRKALPCPHCAIATPVIQPTTGEPATLTPTLVAVMEPTAAPPRETESPVPPRGISHLASQVRRLPRDPTTGKPLEDEDYKAADAEAAARAFFGISPPHRPSPRPAPVVCPKFPSMRQTLGLEAEDLIALFDATPATKVGEKLVFQQEDFAVSVEMLQHRVERLKKLIAASKAIIEGLSVRVMKIRRDQDDILDKAAREKFKRDENARIARSNVKLFRYRAGIRNGNYTEKAWRYQVQPVYFRDLVDDSMTFVDYGAAYYVDGEEKKVDGLVTHTITVMVRDVITSQIFDVSRYEVVMRLDDAALRLLGESENDQKRSWSYWQRWENAVIKAAVYHGVLRPRADLLELLALSPYVQSALNVLEKVEADTTENALALKTGGACYGGSIRSGGIRYRNSGFRQRGLESFDKGPPKDWESGADGSGGDSGFQSLCDVDDDAESYQP